MHSFSIAVARISTNMDCMAIHLSPHRFCEPEMQARLTWVCCCVSHKAVLIVPYAGVRSHTKAPLGKNLLTQEHGCWYRSLLAVVGFRAGCFFKASKWEERWVLHM